jgi:hypothetical protein
VGVKMHVDVNPEDGCATLSASLQTDPNAPLLSLSAAAAAAAASERRIDVVFSGWLSLYI